MEKKKPTAASAAKAKEAAAAAAKAKAAKAAPKKSAPKKAPAVREPEEAVEQVAEVAEQVEQKPAGRKPASNADNQGQVSKVKGLRIGAIILWVLALACEAGAFWVC